MDLKLKADGKEFPISSDIIFNSWFGGIPDSEEYLDLLHDCVSSPNSSIRESIAAMDIIDEQIVNQLLGDRQLSVLKELLSNSSASKYISEKELLRIIDINESDLCCGIADNIDSFELCNITTLAEKLSANNDPKVRLSLASNHLAPKMIISRLKNDPDFGVRHQALKSLDRGFKIPRL